MKNKRRVPPFLIILCIAASPFLLIFLVDEEARRGVAPEIQGIQAWINSKPLSINELKGKVVLVDFWTYSCINCLRTIPYLNAWHDKYGEKGLVIIGVHTPEFNFEKASERVKTAVNDLRIRYPVALDNEKKTWKAYSNTYWPHKYLIDAGGNIRFEQIGEGGYKETEDMIRNVLLEAHYQLDETKTQVFVEPVEHKRIQTPEIYIGSHRNQFLGNPRGLRVGGKGEFKEPESIGDNLFYLVGLWAVKDDFARFEGHQAGKLILNYTAKSVNMVAGAPGGKVLVEVLLDDEPLDPQEAGEDIHFDSENRSWLSVGEGRLYSLIHNRRDGYGKHTLTIKVDRKGLEAYTFTFG
ncbi:MAG TPA: redoxin domain-containing protein [Nitrospiria bacterium]